MTSDVRHDPRGLRALVHEQLPPGAAPVETLCRPVSRYTLDRAGEGVLEATRTRIAEEMGGQPHVVLVLRDGDLDPEADAELTGLLAQTDGGVLVFGVAYTTPSTAAPSEACPECGRVGADVVDRAPGPDHHGVTRAILGCPDCGTVWDSAG